MISLAELQSLYDSNRFLEAFRQSAAYWKPSKRLENLSSDELILGGRLAFRLGGWRLSRRLFRVALACNPSDPRARYFAHGLRRPKRHLFDDLRIWETNPELSGADPDTQASWLASQAITWASLREFSRAHTCIERARSFQLSQSWVLSCESNVFGLEDRWSEALRSAERSWELNPGTPFAAHSLGQSLLNLRRIREAADRLVAAVAHCESYEIVQLACWHLSVLVETIEGDERSRALGRARGLAEQLSTLAPLADRETNSQFARVRLDIADLADDHAAMERWSNEVRSPFHRRVLENLRKNPNGLRVRLPFRRAIQKHEECLPTSIASALAAMGAHIDPDTMASEITFGGTPEWAAAEWLEKLGFVVRFFAVVPEIAACLLKNGIAFVVTLVADASAHAVAAVGLDEAAGTLLIHDPQALRTTEYLLASIGESEAPLGPKGMVIVPSDKAALLDQLLLPADVDAMAAMESYNRADSLSDPATARELVVRLADRQPSHPITRLLKAMQAVQDGRVGVALIEFQELMNRYPKSAFVRARLLSCCRSLGDTALMRSVLASVVERGILPGIQSQQDWFYPPSAYVSEYADLLRTSAETREKARSLLNGVIFRESSCAQAWHILGDLLWDERDIQGALLAYRIAACLAPSNEHYARAYCDALCNAARKEEGLRWLEDRVRSFCVSTRATTTWITWISALEAWGHPERALAATEESLGSHGNSPELIAFVISFSARMGRWHEAEALLSRLETAGNSALFHEAAVDFHQRRGELEESCQHAEAWVQESPLSIQARRELLHMIAKRDGTRAAIDHASRWMTDYTGHDELEQLYCQYLDRTSLPRWKKYSLLLRRAKRNPEDSWTWRELAFTSLSDYESKDKRGRERLNRRIPGLIAQCERTAPHEASTLRVLAQWCEARGEWTQAVDHWLESIDHEPNNSYSYRQVWDCLARSSTEQRKQNWERISTMLLRYPGRLSVAREAIMLAADRFGVAEAEQTVFAWHEIRPDDPEVIEASADLLLEHGSGRTDALRALEMLQPAVERFPYHLGLRFSLANAWRSLGKFKESEEVLAEIIRRHPDDSAAQIQLARVNQRHGRIEEALRILTSAAARDPQNVDLPDVRVQILIHAGRLNDARVSIKEALSRFPESVRWRERAIALLADCGDMELSAQVAREGTVVYPRGAYLWFLLGKTLQEFKRFAAQGEVESCLRRSLVLNQGLFVAADWLAMLLVEQRRYDEADEVMLQIRERLSDPSPALGRLAWIHRQKGNKREAREEMASVLRLSPWYIWGWNVLMGWFLEDEAWNEARSALGLVPPELKTNTQFRRQRLEVLEKTGLPSADLDSEWNGLLLDFPEDVPLHLLRYDSLRNGERLPEAAAVLEFIRPIDPESPYLLARYIEVLSGDQNKKGQVVESLLRIFFAQTEESVWPANYGWTAVQKANWEGDVYQRALSLLKQGSRPTPQALSILASHAAQRSGPAKRTLQPRWRSWLPDNGARELVTLLEIIDLTSWSKGRYRASLLKQLCDVGYSRLVVRYWRKNRTLVETDVDSWAETARALVNLNRKSDVRRLLAQWRERTGVGMWVVTNYVMCLSALRPKQLREMLSSCRDALAGLPHDHCAKFLAHLQAEACALIGDRKALAETWNDYRSYFDGKLEKGEWFHSRRKHLLADVPIIARALRDNDLPLYRRMLWSLRWKQFTVEVQLTKLGGVRINRGWWWIVWALFWLVFLFFRSF
jgi:tetratricopeptide (TPR) repeat protein